MTDQKTSPHQQYPLQYDGQHQNYNYQQQQLHAQQQLQAQHEQYHQQQQQQQQQYQQQQQQPYQQQQYQQQQQPQAYQQQQARGVHHHGGAPTPWQTSLFSCGGCENCLLGCFLPCILVGRTSERMRDPSMQSYDTLNNDCLIMAGINCVTGCGWIYGMMKRGEIREQYNIEGSGFGDCCVSYWCSCCAVIQQEKEVLARVPKTITQAYTSPKDGMQMPPPAHHQ